MAGPGGDNMNKQGIWQKASAMAAQTPESRNRYVDFLRALSIMAVISGHWMVAAPYAGPDGFVAGSLLQYASYSQGLTWVFQVMPVFFLVGGYSNGISYSAALRDGKGYGEWLGGRLLRLLGPTLPLVIAWAAFALLGRFFGLSLETVKMGSRMALIPTWFLAVYVAAVLLVPITYAAWSRWKMVSFWGLVAAAIIDDLLFFNGTTAVGWFNYFFIWLAVHQMGYAWREKHFHGAKKAFPWAIGGFAALVLLVTVGPYPLSMISVPGAKISNTLPPKLPMLALGITQIGLVLSLEAPVRKWLRRATPWTATVLVNGMIMTIYLWHMTAFTLLTGAGFKLGNFGLTILPGSGEWWLAKPLWIGASIVVLLIFSLLFSRFERGGNLTETAAWRMVAGALLASGGLALLALGGVGGESLLDWKSWIVLFPIIGTGFAGLSPLRTAKQK
jgi:hypothetical protein